MWDELRNAVYTQKKKEARKILECHEREIMYSYGAGEIPDECLILIEGIYTDPLCRKCDYLGGAVLSMGTDPALMSEFQKERLRQIFEKNVTEGLAEYLVDVAVDCFSRVFAPKHCINFYREIIGRDIEGARSFVSMGLGILLSEGKITKQELSEIRQSFLL